MKCMMFIAPALLLVWAYSASAQFTPPSLDVGSGQDSTALADTSDTLAQQAAAQGVQPSGPKKLKIVRRKYKYRQQLGLALAMMAFVAIIFMSTQNWNPG